MDKSLKRNFSVHCVIVLSMLLLPMVTYGEVVVFEGKVSRHALIDSSQALNGVVTLTYDSDSEGGFSEATFPFTIPSGKSSTNYQASIDWSVVGSSSSFHDFITVSVRCTQQCDSLNAGTEQAYFFDNSKTTIDKDSAELFGKDDRRNHYTADLTVTPRYALVRGRVALPQGMTAPKDLILEAAVLSDIGPLGYSNIVRSSLSGITIPAGENVVNFAIKLDLLVFNIYKYRHDIRVGVFCKSNLCGELGLTSRQWFDSDGDKFFTNISMVGRTRLDFRYSDHSFVHLMPHTLTLKNAISKTITVARPRGTSKRSEPITGRLIFEGDRVIARCGSSDYDLQQNKESVCVDGIVSFRTRREIIKSTPFNISAGINQTQFNVDFDLMEQPAGSLYENLVVGYECLSGCLESGYQAAGYFKGEGSKSSSKNYTGAKVFKFTPEIESENFTIYLGNGVVIMPAYELLLED